METTDLKDLWETDQADHDTKLSLEKQSEIHLPLERIRRNMRNEFWTTVVLFIGIILFLVFKEMYFFKLKVYIVTLVSSMMLITVFYFVKFFRMYQNLTSVNLSTGNSLRELLYQFRLNEQYYLSYYIAFVPFVVCEMLLVFEFTPLLRQTAGLNFILIFLAACFGTLVVLFSVGKWWFHRYYGKYIKQISAVTDDLF